MKKVSLSAKTFNSFKRDPRGPKVQRIGFEEFRGLAADHGKTKQ